MIIVQKFGGTSVANMESIKSSAHIVKKTIAEGKKVVVIVSAFAGKTDELIEMFDAITSKCQPNQTLLAERDSIISTGEQVSAGLFASYLNTIGVKSRSFTGLQAGIFTDNKFSHSKIETVNLQEVEEALNNNITPVITGFQGYSIKEKRQTTLGRGGSDTSAIAISAKLNATRCEIYKDVIGILTGEPKVVNNAQKIDNMHYNSMLELSSSGAKVLETRAVNFGAKYGIPISVLSSFSPSTGTIVDGAVNEKAKIESVSFSSNQSLYIFTSSNSFNEELKRLDDIFISYKLLSLEKSSNKENKFTVLIQTAEAERLANSLSVKIVSIVGNFLKSDKILEKVLDLLTNFGVEPILTLVSEIKISIFLHSSIPSLIVDRIHEMLIS